MRLSLIVLLLIIVIVILILILIIKLIVIIKQIVIISGMIWGTIIDGDKSFGRQKTEDNGVPLPSTPPSWCGIFTTGYYLPWCWCIGTIYRVWGMGDSIGYLCRGVDSIGGYLFFENFW